ncbi:MAG: DUF523 domain-containing protein [Myxococcota bacterium]
MPQEVWLVSACLLGRRCRYDDKQVHTDVREHLMARSARELVPVCPEVEGGLPVPRPASMLTGGDGHDVWTDRARLVDPEGNDVTRSFRVGAEVALERALQHGATHACLKARSPSCGSGMVWRDGVLQPGDGVTAARLKGAGLVVLTDEQLREGEPPG